MTGLGRLDGDVCRFQVADFAHHDDIGILPQERTQGGSEGETGLFVDVDLVDSRQIDFCRIFRGGDVDFRLVENVQAGIKRNGLAGAGWAGD